MDSTSTNNSEEQETIPHPEQVIHSDIDTTNQFNETDIQMGLEDKKSRQDEIINLLNRLSPKPILIV